MNFDLERVVDTINDSVNHAQNKIEEHQLRLFEQYFEQDGSPLAQSIKVKSKGERGQSISLPLICLISPVALEVSSFSIDLKVPIVSAPITKPNRILPLGQEPDKDFQWGEIAPEYHAEIKITFSTSPPNEAWLRVSSLLLETTFL